MVGDALDWVKVFGCGLEMSERACTLVKVGLKRVGVDETWVWVSGSVLKMSGSEWELWNWMGVGGDWWGYWIV